MSTEGEVAAKAEPDAKSIDSANHLQSVFRLGDIRCSIGCWYKFCGLSAYTGFRAN